MKQILILVVLTLTVGPGARAEDLDEVQVGAENETAEGDAATAQAIHRREAMKVERRETNRVTRDAARAEARAAAEVATSAKKLDKLERRTAELEAERRRQEKKRAVAEKTIAERRARLQAAEDKLARLRAQVGEGKKMAADQVGQVRALDHSIDQANSRLKSK